MPSVILRGRQLFYILYYFDIAIYIYILLSNIYVYYSGVFNYHVPHWNTTNEYKIYIYIK